MQDVKLERSDEDAPVSSMPSEAEKIAADKSAKEEDKFY
jgi:hypothetical protein